MRAFAALIGAAALALTSLVVAPVAAPAAAAPYCANGVLVLVDFGSLGAGIARGCANSPANGLDALHKAGFPTEGTQHDGPGFVCRIKGRPTKAQEQCVRTPPASRYWSYWHARDGQKSWSYSSKGAMSNTPQAGAIEGWAFGSTDVGGTTGGPSVCPAYARTQKQSSCSSSTRSTPTTGRPKATTHHRGDGSGGGARGGASESTSSRPAAGSTGSTPVGRRSSPSTSVRTSASTASPSASAGGSSSAPDDAPSSSRLPTIVDASEVAGKDASAGGGSAGPAVLGIALVALLAGGAGWTVLRRRRADAADL